VISICQCRGSAEVNDDTLTDIRIAIGAASPVWHSG